MRLGSHQSRKKVRFLRRYHCAACKATSAAWVIGEGTGEAARTIDNVFDEGSPMADAEARAAAGRDADLIIPLAVCPKCGAQDLDLVRRIRRRFQMLSAMVGAIGLSLAAWYVLGDPAPLAAILCALLTGFVMRQIWRNWRERLEAARQRVQFLSETELAALEARRVAHDDEEDAHEENDDG